MEDRILELERKVNELSYRLAEINQKLWPAPVYVHYPTLYYQPCITTPDTNPSPPFKVTC